MDKKPSVRILLTLFPENPIHNAALQCLSSVPKSKRTMIICQRIIDGGEKDKLSPAVKDAIYESVKRAFREQGVTQPQTIIPAATPKEDTAGEARRNFLGFLSTLQEEGEDDD